MLYIFYGSDTGAARAKANALVASLVEKRPDASLVRLDSESFEPSSLPELISGQGLFVQKYIVVLDRVFEHEEAKGAIQDSLKDIAASDNIVVMLEGALDTKTKKQLEKAASKVTEFSKKEKKQERFNVFALGDALGRRDKKQLWVLYQEALREGLSPEEIQGSLFWQVKTMLLASKTTTAEEAEMKAFPYNKAKGYAKNYSDEELERLSWGLIEAYHEVRQKGGELNVKLEKWVLGV